MLSVSQWDIPAHQRLHDNRRLENIDRSFMDVAEIRVTSTRIIMGYSRVDHVEPDIDEMRYHWWKPLYRRYRKQPRIASGFRV